MLNMQKAFGNAVVKIYTDGSQKLFPMSSCCSVLRQSSLLYSTLIC